MNRQGRILVMDDEERWRSLLTETLQSGGFHVDAVETIAQAFTQLDNSFYHLLVLDIRMQDSDTNNVEGMEMLERLKALGLVSAVGIIMLSAYGTREQMREAFRDYEVIDFLAKQDFDNIEFLEQVKTIFKKNLQINLELETLWQGISGPDQAVVDLRVGDIRIKRGDALHGELSQELDDLLCRLFYQAKSLLVRPLAPGMSGAGVLWVQPFYMTGSGQAVIVKFGEAKKIDHEVQNFETYVKNFVGGARSTTVLNLHRTARLAGITYSLLGAAGDQFSSFGDFYGKEGITKLTALLDHLFMDTCGTWYANPGTLKPVDLTTHYLSLLSFTYEKLDEAFEKLKNVQGKHKIIFNALRDRRLFTNPILATAGQQLVRTTYECVSHGDLNASNILVDNSGNAWLIDFLRTGFGHILRDIAELDTAVRISLLEETEASLDERLELEESLLSAHKFSQVDTLASELVCSNPALNKAYAVSVHLRKLARKLVDRNPSDDIGEYYIALLYYALNYVRFRALSTVQREHALLSASLLVDHLGL